VENFVCVVVEAGVATNSTLTPSPVVFLELSDTGGTFQNEWFFASNAGKREMLAVGLAAISTQSNVNVWCDPPSGADPQCYNLYLMS